MDRAAGGALGAAPGLAPCASRALSGLAITSFPLAAESSLAKTFADAAARSRAKAVLAALSALLLLGLCAQGLGGAAMALAGLACFFRCRRIANREFGGLSGDLAGWFLQTAEIWMLAALCAVQWGGRILCF